MLKEGWTEELIDKYFSQATDIMTGKISYGLKNQVNPNGTLTSYQKGYEIKKDANGKTIIEITDKNGRTKITVNTNGTYTEEYIKLGATSEELSAKGFTQKQIDEWFTLGDDGIYRMNSQVIATSDYGSTFKEFSTIEELASYIGADSRVQLRKDGFPDEIIDKYFDLKRTGSDGSYSYELKFEGNYEIVDNNDDKSDILKTIRIVNNEDDSIVEIKIKSDGSYDVETNEIITIGKEDNQVVASSAKELLEQGFSNADIKEYFYQKNNQYFLKSNITFSKRTEKGYEMVKITTLDELKEYCGANSRKELKDKGLTDELIDKYYIKEITRDGKINYSSNGYIISINKDGDNVVLTSEDWRAINSAGHNCEEVTIKPDGTYTTVKYTSEQITDTTKTHYMLVRNGLTETDIQKYFTEKDGLYTLKKNIMYKGQFIKTIEQLIDVIKNN